MVQRVGSACRYGATVRAMVVVLCALVWWSQGGPLHAQTATMRWLGRIDTGVNLYATPVLIPNYRNAQDWVLWYRFIEDTTDLSAFSEYSMVHFDSLSVDTVEAIWTTPASNRGSFIPNRVTVADINGDGQSEIFGSETHYIRSTPTGHVIDSIEGGVLGGGLKSDLDGDGYGETFGSHIFWGDSTASLSTRSIVTWNTHLPPRPSWDVTFDNAYLWGIYGTQGHVYVLVVRSMSNSPSESDTARSRSMMVHRVLRLNAQDIASHADTVRVDTTWVPQDFVFFEQVRFETGSYWSSGYKWPSLAHTYYRGDRYVMESGGPGVLGYGLRCYGDSLGLHCTQTYDSDTTWFGLGLSSRTYTSSVLEPDEVASARAESKVFYALKEFADPDSLYMTTRRNVVFPDSFNVIRTSGTAGGAFRFPDITGDGRREVAIVYEHITLGPIIDIYDAWGAVVTSTGGGGGAVRGTVEPTVAAGRLRWAGGDDGPTTVRLYDTGGRLLRSTTIDGLELAIRGIDCTGQSGPVAISFTTASGKHMATTILVE